MTKQSKTLQTILWVALLAFVMTISYSAFAEDLARKLELAQQLQDLRPVRVQIDQAIDLYVERVEEPKRDAVRLVLQKAFNYKALEKASVDAYAQVFSAPELEAMIAYYSKSEARSAETKAGAYAALIQPEIIRQLDAALMAAKTGSNP